MAAGSEPPADDGVRRNSAYALATQLATGVFTAGLTLYLVRALGKDDYGLFALALSITGLLMLVADLGLAQSAGRAVAERRGDPGRVAQALAGVLRLKLLAALLVAALLFALAGPIAAAYDLPEMAWVLRWAGVALAGQSIMILWLTAFSALRRIAVSFRLVLSESAIEASATVAFVVLGAGAAGAAAGRAAGYVAGAILGLAFAARALGRDVVTGPGPGREALRGIARYGGALLVINGIYTLFGQLDTLLIGAILGAGAVGVYAAPLKLTIFLHYPGQALSNAIAPRMARNEHDGPDVRAFGDGLRLLILVQAASAVPLLVWAGPIADVLLGPGYEESADVLRAMTPFVFLLGLGPLISVSVDYLGGARLRIPIALAAVAVNFAIDIVLLPRIGVVAAAIGTSVAYAVYVGGHLRLCRRLLGVSLRPAAVTTARAAVAGAVMALPLLALGTSEIPVWGWFAGPPVALALYVAALVLIREVSRAELAAVRSWISARTGRRPSANL